MTMIPGGSWGEGSSFWGGTWASPLKFSQQIRYFSCHKRFSWWSSSWSFATNIYSFNLQKRKSDVSACVWDTRFVPFLFFPSSFTYHDQSVKKKNVQRVVWNESFEREKEIERLDNRHERYNWRLVSHGKSKVTRPELKFSDAPLFRTFLLSILSYERSRWDEMYAPCYDLSVDDLHQTHHHPLMLWIVSFDFVASGVVRDDECSCLILFILCSFHFERVTKRESYPKWDLLILLSVWIMWMWVSFVSSWCEIFLVWK